MKKLIALLLALVVVFSLVACTAKTETPSAEPEKKEEVKEEPKQEEPKQEEPKQEEKAEPLTIKWAVHNDPNTPLSNDVVSEVKTLIEEKYNIVIDLQTVDAHNTDSLGLYFAGGGDPDVITGTYQVYEMYPKLVNEGFLRTIPDRWLDEYMPDWMASCYEKMDRAAIENQIKIDGETYFVPRVSVQNAYLLATPKSWLDAVGMDVPKTLDELHDLLVAYHTQDPDGNGVDDTYGIHGQYFMNSYLATVLHVSPLAYLRGADGSVYYDGATENFLEFCKTTQQWIKDGAIDPESAVDSEDIWKDKFTNGKLGVFCHDLDYFCENWGTSALGNYRNAHPGDDLVIIPPIADADGTTYVLSMNNVCVMGGSLAFGANCSDEVMQTVMKIKNDLVADYDFYKRVYYGVEGVNYTEENGVITQITDAVKDPLVGPHFAAVPIPKKWMEISYGEWDKELYGTYNDIAKYPHYTDDKFIFTFDTNEALNRYNGDVGTVAWEYWCNVYNPDFDFDATWPDYLKQLDELGLPKILEEYNKILNK